jgi:glycerophosphoryl diester phosphodiesterase
VSRGPERAHLFGSPPVVIGHRGAGRGEVDGKRENTLESFQAAVDAGAGWVEADVRLSGDGALVLEHLPTAPDGRFLSELTASEAQAQGLATFEELLEWLPEGVGLDLDVKTSLEDAVRTRRDTTAGRVAPYAEREARRRPLLATSFDPAGLLILREEAPDVAVGLITWPHFPLRKAIPAAAHLGCDAVVAHARSFGPNRADPAPVHRDAAWSVGVAHEAGLDVVAWSPGPADVARLTEAGVDAFVVDDVAGVLSTVQRTV